MSTNEPPPYRPQQAPPPYEPSHQSPYLPTAPSVSGIPVAVPVSRPATARLNATAERELNLTIAAARQILLTTLRQLGYALVAEQLSVLEAERGSRFGGLTLSPDKVPVGVRVVLQPTDDGCRVVLRVEDRWKIPVGRNWGAIGVYRTVFTATTEALDRALMAACVGEIEPWMQDLGDGDVAALQSAGDLAARAQKVVARGTDRILEGTPDTSKSAAAAAGVGTLDFVNGERHVSLSADDVDAILTTGQLVVAKPGTLPVNLVADVQAFVIDLEEHVAATGVARMGGAASMAVADAHVPVVAFLFQQARLRERLPLRLRLVCTTCRLEKIINPDFQRMRERSRRAKILTSSVGVFFGARQVSPYIMLGRLVQLKKSDPDFVCQRCQGLDAEEGVVTFCPTCGERRDESVLRTCPRCEHDFRTIDPATPTWRELPAPTPAVQAPPPPPYVATPAPPPPPAWRADPHGRAELRYWDGTGWTRHVSTGGVASVDPLG